MESLLTKEQLNADWYLELATQAIYNKCIEQAESHLTLAFKFQNDNVNAIVTYGNLLISERRFIEAQRLVLV